MNIDVDSCSQLRLLQFLSPVAPVGSYSYSQGVEWAVNEGWLHDEGSFAQWIDEQLSSILGEQELPLLIRLYRAVKDDDVAAAENWSQCAIAIRDTSELRAEERGRAASYLRVLETIMTIDEHWPREIFLNTPLASMAWFSVKHDIPERALLLAYAHNWLESSLITGIKIVPLGQSSGQKLMYSMASSIMTAVSQSELVEDDRVGFSLPALSMASAQHELQYSRVYRS